MMTPLFFVHGVKLVHHSLLKSSKIIFISSGWNVIHGSIIALFNCNSITSTNISSFFSWLMIKTIIISFVDLMIIINLCQSYLAQCCCTDLILRFHQFHHFFNIDLKILKKMRYENNIRNLVFNLPPYLDNMFFDHTNPVYVNFSHQAVHEHEMFFS